MRIWPLVLLIVGTAIPASAQPVSGLKADERWEQGWVVSVTPQAPNGRQEDPIGRFFAKPDGLVYGDFRKTVSHPGWAKLSGTAWFQAKEAGRYVFIPRISWDVSQGFGYAMTCRINLSVNGAELVGEESTLKQVTTQRASDRTFPSGADLQEGAVPIKFDLACFIDNGTDNTDREFDRNPAARAWFDTIRLRFAIRGPDDMGPRPLEPNEILTAVKKTAGKPRR